MSDDPSANEEPRGPDDLPELLGDEAPGEEEPTAPADEAATRLLPDPNDPGI